MQSFDITCKEEKRDEGGAGKDFITDVHPLSNTHPLSPSFYPQAHMMIERGVTAIIFKPSVQARALPDARVGVWRE